MTTNPERRLRSQNTDQLRFIKFFLTFIFVLIILIDVACQAGTGAFGSGYYRKVCLHPFRFFLAACSIAPAWQDFSSFFLGDFT